MSSANRHYDSDTTTIPTLSTSTLQGGCCGVGQQEVVMVSILVGFRSRQYISNKIATTHTHDCTQSLLYHMTTINIQHGCRTYYVQQNCLDLHNVFRSHHYSTSVLLMFDLISTCEKLCGTEPNRLWGFSVIPNFLIYTVCTLPS